MKLILLKTLVVAAGIVAMQVTPCYSAVTVTGATLVWAQDPSTDPGSFADTIGGNDRWNLYVRPTGASDFLNSDDGDSSRFSATLDVGDSATWEIFVNSASWGDNTVDNPGSYLNLFVGDRSGPAISARLTAGNTGVVAPLTAAQVALVPNDADGSLVPPAGTLSYASGGDLLQVLDMRFSTVADSVSGFKDLPDVAGVGALDTMIELDVRVIPEPSVSILALIGGIALALRRRRK